MTARGPSGSAATAPSERGRRLRWCKSTFMHLGRPKSHRSSFFSHPHQIGSASLSWCSYTALASEAESNCEADVHPNCRPVFLCAHGYLHRTEAFHGSWMSESVSLWVVDHYFPLSLVVSFIYCSYRALLCITWHLINTTTPADNQWNSVRLR